MIIPFAVSPPSFQFSPLIIGTMSIMAILFIVIILLAVPAFVIALSRMYMILSGIEMPAPEDQEPAITLVGGI